MLKSGGFGTPIVHSKANYLKTWCRNVSKVSFFVISDQNGQKVGPRNVNLREGVRTVFLRNRLGTLIKLRLKIGTFDTKNGTFNPKVTILSSFGRNGRKVGPRNDSRTPPSSTFCQS